LQNIEGVYAEKRIPSQRIPRIKAAVQEETISFIFQRLENLEGANL
jgi:hypothetical protein